MEDVNSWQLKFQPCCYSDKFLNELYELNEKVDNPVDINEIKKAIFYARKYHGTQIRQSGEPYYSHPIEVAYMLARYAAKEEIRYFRTDLLVTSVLHDTIEDTKLTFNMITDIFGAIVAEQVEDLTRIKNGLKLSAAETVRSLWLQKKSDVLLMAH